MMAKPDAIALTAGTAYIAAITMMTWLMKMVEKNLDSQIIYKEKS
jgi:ABC-type amino acid transport system permease subunit